MKTIFKFFVLIGSGFLVAVLIFEVFLRAVEVFPSWKVLPVAEVSLYGPDEEAAYTHRLDVGGVWSTGNRAKVSTTSFGVRSNDIKNENIETRDGWFKVGIIGDSIPEALQVEDSQTFSALIEKNLQKQDKKVRIYNLGLAGATPVIHAIRAKRFAEELHLDLIIIIDDPHSITQRLDRSSGGTLPYYKVNEEGDVVIKRPYLNSPSYRLKSSHVGEILYFFINNFRVFAVLNNRLNRGFFDELITQMNTNDSEKDIKNSTQCDRESLSVLRDIQNPEMTDNKLLLDAFFADLSDVQNRFNTRVVLGLYDTWSDCPEDLQNQSRKQLKYLLNKNGLRFFDLKKSLEKNLSASEELKDLRGFGAKRGGGHLNKRGHQAFSETISEHINSHQAIN